MRSLCLFAKHCPRMSSTPGSLSSLGLHRIQYASSLHSHLQASQLSPPTLGKQGALYKNNCWNCCGNLILKHRRCEAAQNHMYDVLMG